MKVVNPESVGLDSNVLGNIREYLDKTYVKDGKYVGTMTLVSRKERLLIWIRWDSWIEKLKEYAGGFYFRIYSMSKAITSIAN